MKTEDAIRKFGTGAKLARALGITPAAVYQWGVEVPRLRQYEIRGLLEQRSADVEDASEREQGQAA